jgi:hypothetical protein
MKQTFSRWHGQQCADFQTPAGFAEDHDIFRVTPEGGDIIMHSLQACNQVQHSGIAGRSVFFAPDVPEMEVAEYAKPVIDSDNHHITAA